MQPVTNAAERQALLDHLRQAVQWRTLGALLPTLAHDVRAPLNSLVINVELLKELGKPGSPDDPQLEERREKSIGALLRAIHQLRLRLDTLIATAREPESGSAEFDLCEEAAQIEAMLRGLAQVQRVTLRAAIPEKKILVSGQRGLLRQAALGLALNALKAMPAGGELEIQVAEHDGSAVLSMIDNGPGIPDEIRSRVADLHLEGGVGLPVAQAILAAQGGSLTIDSSAPVGTRVDLSLPLARGGK